MSPKPLAGKIAIVTGASRGQGIALQLGEAGATVYVTGRKPADSQQAALGLPALEQTAKEITERGGKGIVRYVDHAIDQQIKDFFAALDMETGGQLDILVNNAYSAVTAILEESGATGKKRKFYEAEPEFWDLVNNVGLRNHYFCTVYAARIMVRRGSGLIVNVSSLGGKFYLLNVAYGVGKAATDRMAADTAVELKSDNVTVVSLWPGPARTQILQASLSNEFYASSDMGKRVADFESIEYSGKAVVALATDPNILEKTGRILLTVDLGDEYGFVDIDGRKPPNSFPM